MEEVYCNACWQEVQTKAVHIPCDHVFCDECAGRELLVSGQCSFCNAGFESTKDMLEFQIVGARVDPAELRDLRAMLLAVGVANGAQYVEGLAAQAVSMEKEQAKAKLQVQGRHMRSLQKALRTAESQREEEMRVAREEMDKLKAVMAELKTNAAKSSSENEALRAKVEDSVRQITNWKSMYESLRDGGNSSGNGPGGGDLGLGKRKQTVASSSSSGMLLGRGVGSLTPTHSRHATTGTSFGVDRHVFRPSSTSSGTVNGGRPNSASSGRWPSFPPQHPPGDEILHLPRNDGATRGSISPRRSNHLFSPPPTRHGPASGSDPSQTRKSSPAPRQENGRTRRTNSPRGSFDDSGAVARRGRFGEARSSSSLSFTGVRRL